MSSFIPPMLPTAAKAIPIGAEWLHEAKMDGFRAQLHITDGDAFIYGRNGSDLAKRFRAIRPILRSIQLPPVIIDCELVASGSDGMPSFNGLMEGGNQASLLSLWCFDLLDLKGVRTVQLPLMRRRALLAEVVALADDPRVQFSGEFADPLALLAAGERNGLEGIVSKRRDSSYRSGPTRDWLKIKTKNWKEENRERFSMLHKKR